MPLVTVLAGCLGAWDYQRGLTQSTTGSNPIVTVRADQGTRQLTIECGADGLQLSVGQREPATTFRIDDEPPETWPTRISVRGVPVMDLRAPLAGGRTGEERLSGADRLALLAGPQAGAATLAVFDVSHADQAIRRLRCR